MRAFLLLALLLIMQSAVPRAACGQEEAPAGTAVGTAVAVERTLRVRDEQQAPISGAAVTLRYRGTDLAGQTGITGADGSWKFFIRSAVAFQISVAAPGRVPALVMRDSTAADQTILLTLRTVKPIAVRLVDDKGAPVAGASISMGPWERYATAAPDDDPPNDTPTVRSDAEGRTVVPFGSAGAVMLVRIKGRGFQSMDARLQVPDDAGLVLRLVPGATLTGRLVRGDGTPMAGLQVGLSNLGGTARSGEDGRFEIAGLDEGRDYPCLVPAPQGEADLCSALRSVRTKRGQTTDIGDLMVTPGGVIKGTLETPREGEGPQNYVYIRSVEDDDSMQPFITGVNVTGEKFEQRLAPGRYEIFAEHYTNRGRDTASQAVVVTEGAVVEVALKWAAAAPPPPVPVRRLAEPEAGAGGAAGMVAGQVVDDDGEAVPGATVLLASRGGPAKPFKVDAEGKFSIDTGPPVDGEWSYLSAKLGTQTTDLLRIAGGRQGVVLRLQEEGVLRVRAVDKDGKAIPGATITPATVRFPGNNGGYPADVNVAQLWPELEHPFAAGENPAEIRGLQNGVYLSVDMTAPGYALYRHVIALPRRGIVELPLSRETVIRGRLTMAGRPLSASGLIMKAQTWNFSNYWWTGAIGADGIYEIRKVPSLEQLREPALSLNIHSFELGPQGPNVRSEWIHGYDMLLTVKNGPRTEWWLVPVEAAQAGMVYREGETVQHDIALQPMGQITGIVPGPNKANVTVSYGADDSIYGDWQTETDKNGRFTLYARSGHTVVLRWPGGSQEVAGIKAHEVREVTLVAGSVSAPRAVSAMPQEWMVRVIGPDGATVPRPVLDWRQPGGDSWTRGSTVPGAAPGYAASAMDGTVRMYRFEPAPTLEFSSEYMDAPVLVKPLPGQIVQLKFNRVPPVPPLLAWSANTRRLMQSEAPAAQPATDLAPPPRLKIGDIVPAWKGLAFVRGGDDVAGWKGRVLVVNFGDGGSDAWLQATLRRIPSLASLQVLSAGQRGAGEGDFSAAARDTPLPGGIGYNATLFGGNHGSILIGPDGRLVATGLAGPTLDAKIDQMLEQQRLRQAPTP